MNRGYLDGIALPERDLPIMVTGAGGFIGGWMVRSLIDVGFSDVRAVDIKAPRDWFQISPEAENLSLDLKDQENCRMAMVGRREVFNFAADMGGMGFIEANKSACMLSSLINTHLLVAGVEQELERYFFASSACVYNANLQTETDTVGLSEEMAYPALPEDGYGWEKLFGERMAHNFAEDYGLTCRIARFHNVYGPHGSWQGGREKAPAAISRKVAQAKLSGRHEIEIWGDGEQTRSFTYINDAISGSARLMWSATSGPLNIGSDEMVSIDELVTAVEEIAEITLVRNYLLEAPLGVPGRNSDNTRIKRELGWAPTTRLKEGIRPTYEWIHGLLAARHC